MGDLEAQSTKAQMAQPWSYQLFAVLMILVLMMCATLTVFVAIKSSQNAQRISDLQNFYMDDIEEEVPSYINSRILMYFLSVRVKMLCLPNTLSGMLAVLVRFIYAI